jgi:hypothetical protein
MGSSPVHDPAVMTRLPSELVFVGHAHALMIPACCAFPCTVKLALSIWHVTPRKLVVYVMGVVSSFWRTNWKVLLYSPVRHRVFTNPFVGRTMLNSHASPVMIVVLEPPPPPPIR